MTRKQIAEFIAELERQLSVAQYERDLCVDDIAKKDARIVELEAKGCAAAWFKRQRDNRWLHRTYVVHSDCDCWKREALAAIDANLHRGTGSPLPTVQHLGAARTAPVFSDEK